MKPFAWAYRFVDKDEGPCDVWNLTRAEWVVKQLRERNDYEIRELIDARDLLPLIP